MAFTCLSSVGPPRVARSVIHLSWWLAKAGEDVPNASSS